MRALEASKSSKRTQLMRQLWPPLCLAIVISILACHLMALTVHMWLLLASESRQPSLRVDNRTSQIAAAEAFVMKRSWSVHRSHA